MTKVLRALPEGQRRQVRRGLLQEANDRLDIVYDIMEEREIPREAAEHHALLKWAFGPASYTIETLDRKLKAEGGPP